MSELIIKPGREKSLLRHHPWIFSGAVSAVHGFHEAGETVEVLSSSGKFLGRAAYNPKSNIAGRIWTWDESEQINLDFFNKRVEGAMAIRRKAAELIPSNAMRLVHGESDGLPGLILDKYDDVSVCQFLTAGIEYWRRDVVEIIKNITGARSLYDRSDVDIRQLEGLSITTGLLNGMDVTQPIEIIENGIKILVDVMNGHKTGYYLDQRDNRLLARNISKDKKVLDCFAYTGGFAINTLVGNANNVLLVDSSAGALELARRNFELNNVDLARITFIEQDVFTYLRTLRDMGENFDVIILDPPKFAPTVSQIERATRAYKDINLLAFKLLNKDGYLLTFSCSGGIREDLFQKIVSGAALDAKADAVILKRLHQAVDHPVSLSFPEGAYLKGFLIQKKN